MAFTLLLLTLTLTLILILTPFHSFAAAANLPSTGSPFPLPSTPCRTSSCRGGGGHPRIPLTYELEMQPRMLPTAGRASAGWRTTTIVQGRDEQAECSNCSWLATGHQAARDEALKLDEQQRLTAVAHLHPPQAFGSIGSSPSPRRCDRIGSREVDAFRRCQSRIRQQEQGAG
ncbi:hypothetical protein V8E36_007985 [Tilletia maclaganii]